LFESDGGGAVAKKPVKKTEKKKPGKRVKKRIQDPGAAMIEELGKVAAVLGEEDIDFLLNQARVLVYNRRVTQLNEELKGNGAARKVHATAKGTGASARGAEDRKKPGRNEVEIVEKPDSGNFFIVVNNYRILFTRDEMKSLVRICHAAADESDASARLFTWLTRNRKDFLIDGGIESAKNPYLQSLFRELVIRYRVREGG
jgi:hypothetical protein